jgi:hypothetical protein
MRPHGKTKLGFFPLPLKNAYAFGGALPIFPMPEKGHTATDYIDWWKRYTIRAALFGGQSSSLAN